MEALMLILKALLIANPQI